MQKYYHDLYLKCDVLQLTEVFEKSRNKSLGKLWIMSEQLFELNRFTLGCNAMILNILKNYVDYIIIIIQLQIR